MDKRKKQLISTNGLTLHHGLMSLLDASADLDMMISILSLQTLRGNLL